MDSQSLVATEAEPNFQLQLCTRDQLKNETFPSVNSDAGAEHLRSTTLGQGDLGVLAPHAHSEQLS